MSNNQYLIKNGFFIKCYKDCKDFEKYVKLLRLEKIVKKKLIRLKNKMRKELTNKFFEKNCKYAYEGEIYFYDGVGMKRIKRDGDLCKRYFSYFDEMFFDRFKKIEE